MRESDNGTDVGEEGEDAHDDMDDPPGTVISGLSVLWYIVA